ncbi:MAG: amino acid ABC transporter permease [Paracoccaceae bacterium]|nr:amino acid ABC transporter permease [Paracoccaceae bacterium]
MDWTIITDFDFEIIWRYLPALFKGLWNNIILTSLGFLAGGIFLGTLLAIANLSGYRIIRWPAFIFVEFWRSTPLLVQAVWMHFSFPVLSGLQTTPFQSALLALVFNVSAYCSEIIRAGILGVPAGQFEAARSLGLTRLIMWRKIVLPQAIKIVIPPLIGTVISIFKATTILSVLAINDVMRAAQRVSSYTFKPVEIYTTAALLAFTVGLAITLAGTELERRFRRNEA